VLLDQEAKAAEELDAVAMAHELNRGGASLGEACSDGPLSTDLSREEFDERAVTFIETRDIFLRWVHPPLACYSLPQSIYST